MYNLLCKYFLSLFMHVFRLFIYSIVNANLHFTLLNEHCEVSLKHSKQTSQFLELCRIHVMRHRSVGNCNN
jgi:hypothetical protein